MNFQLYTDVKIGLAKWQAFLIVASCLLTIPVQAIELEDFYLASVVIESRNDESARTKAISTALRQVLIKITGLSSVVEEANVRQAINRPESYVESWVYRTQANSAVDAAGIPEGEVLELEVSFYETGVQRLLESSNLSLWPSNRQETLVWIVTQDELGEKVALNSGELDSEILTVLEQTAELRGLPILLPLMDIEDQFAINVNELWELDEEALLSASIRYQTESVLGIRMYRSLSGELLARSVYLFRERTLNHQSFEENMEGFLDASVSLAAEELSGYYAVNLSNQESTVAATVTLAIEGVADLKDYAGLLDYLSELTVIGNYQLKSIDQQSLVLTLTTGGQLRQLVEAIALDNKLEKLSELQRNSDGVFLSYRWFGQ